MLLCSMLLPLRSLPHSSLSIRISQRLLYRFSFHYISFTGCIAPVVAFALSACALCPFLSFQQHVSRSSLSISFHSIRFTGCLALCCCLCALCPIPLFSSGHLIDFFAAFRFIPSVSLSALPLLLPLCSLPHSSLSVRTSQRLLCCISFHSIGFTVCITPVVAFALSAPFLSFYQDISKTSLLHFVSFHQFHCLYYPCFAPCCWLCSLFPLSLPQSSRSASISP